MRERLRIRTKSELKDFLGFVILCLPDSFPTGYDAELLPKNVDEAFSDIFRALDELTPKSGGAKADHEKLLSMVRKAKRYHLEGDASACSKALQEFRFALMRPSRGKPAVASASTATPREQGDRLMNEAINLSYEMIVRDGSHIPFAKVLNDTGGIETILVDDSEVRDPEVLIDTLDASIRERSDLRAVALTINVDYQETEGGPRIDAIVIDIDHIEDRPIRCLLPYSRSPGGEVVLGEIIGQEAKRKYFSAKDKVSRVK